MPIIYTPTPSPASPTPGHSPTSELYKTECIEIVPSIYQEDIPQYSIVFNARGEGPRYIYSFTTGKRFDFPENFYPQSTSPDGKWLLYFEDDKNQSWLVAETYDKKIKRDFYEGDWMPSAFWSGNQYFFINLSHQGALPPVLAFDPQTSKQTLLQTKYPNLELFWVAGGPGYHFGNSTVIYDPSLKLVVYLKTLEERDRYRRFITLYNRETKTELASLEDEPTDSINYFHSPVWSNDGEEVIVANHLRGGDEIYSIQRDGHINQLTNFRSYNPDLKIIGISLSPDKRQLAFWMILSETPLQEQLAVMNMETKEIYDLCIPATAEYGGQPIWSPDSRYIAIGDLFQKNRHQTTLVDLQAKWAAQVSDTSYQVGWLKEP